MITALAGGVGAARLLRGMVEAVPADEITAVVNTGDDTVLHGLHISPDLDTVLYTLADAINPETGWGLAGETWRVMDSLERLGGTTWFNLGDQDLATHCYRTQRLGEGAGSLERRSPRELARSWGVGVRLLPVTDDPLRTRLLLEGGDEVGFQEYFVKLRHDVAVAGGPLRRGTERATASGARRTGGHRRRRHGRRLPLQPGGLHRPAAGRARRARGCSPNPARDDIVAVSPSWPEPRN